MLLHASILKENQNTYIPQKNDRKFLKMKGAHKRDREEEESEDAADGAVALDVAVREKLGEWYSKWRAGGHACKKFLAFFEGCGLVLMERTLRRWKATYESTGHALSVDKKSGKKPGLMEWQKRIMVGFICDQNEKNVPVHIRTVKDFLAGKLSVPLKKSAVQRYIVESGFSKRKLKTKTKGYKVDTISLARKGLDWLLHQHLHHVLNYPRDKLCSVDFTFTGHRTDPNIGYQVRGTSQGKSSRAISRFTNCIVTCVWADGVNRTPPILYTLNAAFRWDRSSTARRDEQKRHLKAMLRKNLVDSNRVVYVGKETKEVGTYVSESSDLIRHFFRFYKIGEGILVLSDEGKSFGGKKNDVFVELGFANHVTYPPDVHHFLSPNDNHLHGLPRGLGGR